MTSSWTRSLPNVSVETKPFWDGCREGKFVVQYCTSCGKYQSYYRSFCCHCWEGVLEDRVASGFGEVWGVTVVYQNKTPGWENEVPYALAAVQLDEGVKYITNIVNCDPESVSVGDRVRVTFQVATDEITIPYFEPVGGPHA
jgi:uncharacterized OB-fold protein